MVYVPKPMPEIRTVDDLRKWVEGELQAISRDAAETIAVELRVVHREPDRPREGMIVSADGTDWDPGAGAGAYEYIGGTWVKL